jgi:hypothetical protein
MIINYSIESTVIRIAVCIYDPSRSYSKKLKEILYEKSGKY